MAIRYDAGAMKPTDFLEHWRQRYGETPLVGHVLRRRFPRRWLRVHSLPESKRYAETDDERREILRRQNALCSDLIGDGERCVIVFGQLGEGDGDGDSEGQQLPEDAREVLRGFAPTFLTRVAAADVAGDPELDGEIPLMMAELAWRPGAIDAVLLAVADDILETPLLVSVERGRIVAPYDGGVDVIVDSEELRDQLRARYASWLSRHPAGL